MALADAGYNIAGVHLDRRSRSQMPRQCATAFGDGSARRVFFNTNTADPAVRAEILDTLTARFASESGTVRVIMHSLAFGTPLPLVGERRSISGRWT